MQNNSRIKFLSVIAVSAFVILVATITTTQATTIGTAVTTTDLTATGNLIIGNGTPGVTQNGEDAYIEGTLEVDGAVQFDNQLRWGAGVAVTAGQYSVGRNADATNLMQLNVPTGATHEISINDIPRVTIADSTVVITQAIATSGSPTGLTFTGGAHTTLAASTETTDVFFDLTRTVQFAAGTLLTTQRAMRIGQPTYGFVEASTINTATTVEIAGPPRAGANATITTSSALKIGRGDSTNPVDTPNGATMAVIDMPDIANGVGAMTNLIGFQLSGSTAQLGNQNATLDSFTGMHLLGVTLTSGATSTRTVGFAVTLDVAGPPVASTNVVFSGPARAVDIGGDVITKGTAQELRVSTGAHTGMTASTATAGVLFDLSATKQWAMGAIGTQREFDVRAPTYAFVSTSTITSAGTMSISGPPQAGASAIITDAIALVVGEGGASFPVNSTSATMLAVRSPNIADGVGAMTNLVMFQVTGGTPNLGNQEALLDNYFGARIIAPILTSTTNMRTITTAASLRVSGGPIASSNVTITGPSRAADIGGDAVTKGTAQELRVRTGTHTGMTLSTEATGIDFDLSATKEWAMGDIATQREFRIQAPTYGFVGASTITNAQTIFVNRPPRAGTSATITTATSFQMGGAGADVNATTSSHLQMYPLAIKTNYGAMTGLFGLLYTSGGTSVSLGNQNATLTNLNAVRLDSITYTSGAPTRTVTNPATLYIGGAPVASGNVTFTNTGLALHVDADISRFDGGIDLDADGVRITEDSDGAITFLGLGNGSDEDLTINLDDTANTIALSSSTGVTDVRWDTGTGVGQLTLDGSTGGCIMLRDTDDAGWTEVDALDGVLTASIDADGICD